MKIYVAHASGWDYETQLYDILAKAELGVELVFPHRDQTIMAHSKPIIETCDLLLAEVSRPSTGLGIELAWAHAASIPILAVHQASLTPSAAIHAVTKNIHAYVNVYTLVTLVRDFLKAD